MVSLRAHSVTSAVHRTVGLIGTVYVTVQFLIMYSVLAVRCCSSMQLFRLAITFAVYMYIVTVGHTSMFSMSVVSGHHRVNVIPTELTLNKQAQKRKCMETNHEPTEQVACVSEKCETNRFPLLLLNTQRPVR